MSESRCIQKPEHNYMGGGGGGGQWWSSIFGASATPGGCEHNQMGGIVDCTVYQMYLVYCTSVYTVYCHWYLCHWCHSRWLWTQLTTGTPSFQSGIDLRAWDLNLGHQAVCSDGQFETWLLLYNYYKSNRRPQSICFFASCPVLWLVY